MHFKYICYVILVFSSLFINSPLLATQGDIRISGFARAAGSLLVEKAPAYLNRIDRDGDAGDTQFGVNIHADLGKGYQVAGQIWAAGTEGEAVSESGPTVERFNIVLDWAFLSKRISNNWSVSAGKIKYPNLLVSDYIDVGLAYPWVRPPEEIYRFETEGPYISLESFEGFKADYALPISDSDLSIQVYGGQSVVEDGHLERMFGVKASWITDNYTLVLAHNTHLMDTFGDERGVLNGETANVTNAGATVDLYKFLVYTEYVLGKVEDDEITGFYFTVGSRIGNYLPHVTFANVENSEDWGQSSIALGLKYQLMPSTSLKFEVKNIKPNTEEETITVGEASEEGAGFFAGEVEDDRVNVISIAVDVVF